MDDFLKIKEIEEDKRKINHTIHSLFSCPVYVCNDYVPDKNELIFLLNQKKRQNEGNFTSVNSYVLNGEGLSGLNDFINKQLNIYFTGHLNYSLENEIYITQSWVNYTYRNGYHHSHFHKNSLISGVFYIDNPTSIFFSNDTHFFNNLDLKKKLNTENQWNQLSFGLKTKLYDLILFPSSLRHNVAPYYEENARISLSFNTWFKGNIGNNIGLTEIKKV
jgi:uncharacterized protein (TIGR02466 family)